jgi:hypothetical protein
VTDSILRLTKINVLVICTVAGFENIDKQSWHLWNKIVRPVFISFVNYFQLCTSPLLLNGICELKNIFSLEDEVRNVV